jgi:hypothetical protein
VTVRNPAGAVLTGVAVTLTATPSDSNVFTSPGASGVTDATGVFRADFASGQAALKTITATAGGVTLLQTPAVAVMPVLVGAGDIAVCGSPSDDATANLLDNIPGQVFALGDNAYPDGTAAQFADCYDPTWGRHKGRTRPIPGNRDYNTAGAAGYYGYFGTRANPLGGTGNSQGYYSYDVGTWHVVALNSEISTSVGSPQYEWLRQDLNGRSDQCVVAYWHKPIFASNSSSSAGEPLWQVLADSSAELVLNGHAHIYERFAPMNAAGGPDPNGIREFVIGTGGVGLNGSFATNPPNLQVRDNTTHGVLRLTLYANSYRWEFIPAPGFGSFTDSGTASCH